MKAFRHRVVHPPVELSTGTAQIHDLVKEVNGDGSCWFIIHVGLNMISLNDDTTGKILRMRTRAEMKQKWVRA